MDRAIAEARAASLLGDNVFRQRPSSSLATHLGAGAYICGEETALLSSLEGFRGQPRLEAAVPRRRGGLYACPTVVNNVETIMNVPHILANGGQWYKQWGARRRAAARRCQRLRSREVPDKPRSRSGLPLRTLIESPECIAAACATA